MFRITIDIKEIDEGSVKELAGEIRDLMDETAQWEDLPSKISIEEYDDEVDDTEE